MLYRGQRIPNVMQSGGLGLALASDSLDILQQQNVFINIAKIKLIYNAIPELLYIIVDNISKVMQSGGLWPHSWHLMVLKP